MVESRRLRVFLCHASQDKPRVRELYKRLKSEGWIEPWLDEEELLPGQDFDLEIYRAIRDTDAIIICLSTISVVREGYINREIRRALDIAQEKAEGAIYVIPLRLDDCNPSFEQLRKLHWADYFTPNAHGRLLKSLRARAIALKLLSPAGEPIKEHKSELPREYVPPNFSDVDLDLCRFIQIPQTHEVPYPFWIGKYPVTNAQYERFLNAPDYATESYWRGFLKFNEDCIQIGRWGDDGLYWLKKNMKVRFENKDLDWVLENFGDKSKGPPLEPPLPEYWNDTRFGISNPDNPVVGVTWFEASAYCNWLFRHWSEVAESNANSILRPRLLRLPLDTEWTSAAGGNIPVGRYPWDAPGKVTKDEREIIRRANVGQNNIGHTTPVNAYLRGVSPHGVMDMAGNVWEWQGNYGVMEKGWLALRGGAWSDDPDVARVRYRFHHNRSDSHSYYYGFRVMALARELFS